MYKQFSVACARVALVYCVTVAFLAFSVGRAAGQTPGNAYWSYIKTNVQNATSYTVSSHDCGKLLSLSNQAGVAVTLPQAGSAGLPAGCWLDIQNTGTGLVTLSPSNSTIDGTPSVSLAANQGLRLVSGGTGYFTQRGQGSGTPAAATIAGESSGTAIGSFSALNITSGIGVSCIPQINAGVMTVQCSADTAYVPTKTNLQSAGNPQICTSSSQNATTYTAACATTLTQYAAGQTLYWRADITNVSATPTLNIDTLGAINLVRQDGTALAIGDIAAGMEYRIWYDGTDFHVVEAGIHVVQSGASPVDYPDVKTIPAANCSGANAGSGWSIGSGGTAVCRAGTNNQGGFISITDSSATYAQFAISLPEDWDTAQNPYVRLAIASSDSSSGHTVIPQVRIACAKGDGSTTDDVAFNSAHLFTAITLNGTANQFWSNATVQLTSGDLSGCSPGAMMMVQVGRATDTATSAQFYWASVTVPRKLLLMGN